VVAAVSAALGCRDWRLALPAAALLALFLAAVFGVGGRFFEVGGVRGACAGVAALAGGSETRRRGEFRVWRRLSGE